MSKDYYTYLLTNQHFNVLYTGVTNNLVRRVDEHKNKLHKGFTQRYNVTRLVYYEMYDDITDAIAREKQIKKYSHKKKKDLIEKLNPDWKDLYETIR